MSEWIDEKAHREKNAREIEVEYLFDFSLSRSYFYLIISFLQHFGAILAKQQEADMNPDEKVCKILCRS